MGENGLVLYDPPGDDGVATVTLNRPEKRNALNAEAVTALADAFRAAEAEPRAKLVLLRGRGADFCAGADLAALERIAAGAGALENLGDAATLGDLFILMRRLDKPVVAAVQGHALAGGAGLATAADLIVAAESAVIGYPEIHLGFVPAMVMALLRRAVGEKVAFQLVALGDPVAAPEAQRLGLVHRCFPEDTFEADVLRYAGELARRSSSALRLTKRLLYGIDGASFEDAIGRGAEVNALARMTDDTRSGIRRFLERRGQGARSAPANGTQDGS